jgi:hypothetical protein
MAWTWRYENAEGAQLSPDEGPRPESFATRSDAESWLGESWRELREAGVYQVSLFEGDRLVYGPMGLDPA